MEKIKQSFNYMGLTVDLILDKDDKFIYVDIVSPFFTKREQFSRDVAKVELQKYMDWLNE